MRIVSPVGLWKSAPPASADETENAQTASQTRKLFLFRAGTFVPRSGFAKIVKSRPPRPHAALGKCGVLAAIELRPTPTLADDDRQNDDIRDCRRPVCLRHAAVRVHFPLCPLPRALACHDCGGRACRSRLLGHDSIRCEISG